MAYYSSTLFLNPSVLVRTINGLAPFTLNINSIAAAGNYKVYKIVWNFGDGSAPLIIKLQPQKNFNSLNVLNVPTEPGDPRNEIISKTFFLEKDINKNLKTSLKIYWIQPTSILAPNYYEYKINLNLSAPNSGQVSSDEDFSGGIHLVSTRMFGSDNLMLYNFESLEPNYLLPVLVKWTKENIQSENSLIGLNSPTFRPYKLLPSVDLTP